VSEPSKAVFLSYAHEDMAAALQIAEVLRGQGIEVWFDQSELRGGDAWDAKIRHQIKTCALFLPVISANTQARREGYFRLEWRLADQRTHLMGKAGAYIVPVCIDRTSDREADVPDSFMDVQWARLPDAAALTEFAEHVNRLLLCGGPQITPAPFSLSQPPAETQPPMKYRERQETAVQRGWPQILAIVAMILGCAIAAYFALRPKTEESVEPKQSKVETKSPASSPVVAVGSDKSIAVLPFANMSDDKDASAFFSDGIHEDILTNLALLRELRVVSRTSVMGYRTTTKKSSEIARELGVVYLLEGSVRRMGNKVRVTGQLIRAATDEHVWAKSYDRDLTDIFAIQAALAEEIAAALRATLSPGEKIRLERPPTENLAAYELVLKARQIRNAFAAGGPTARASWGEMEGLLQSALKLDPNYAGAYAELASVLAALGGAENVAKAKLAVENATRLGPNSPEAALAAGDYHYAVGDYEPALKEFERFATLRPNDANYFDRIGMVYRKQGRKEDAVKNFRKVKELDPGNLRNSQQLVLLLLSGRRLEEAIAEQRYIVRRIPDNREANYYLAHLAHLATGSTREYEQVLQQFSEPMDRAWAIRLGKLADAVRLDQGPAANSTPSAIDADAITMGTVHAARRDYDAARSRLGDLPQRLRGHASTFAEWTQLGYVEALVGNKDEAMRCAHEAAARRRDSSSPTADLARLYAWTGEKEAAITAYAALLSKASPPSISRSLGNLNIHFMKTHPEFAPLRGDPRFEALLNDPKNNAPLF
jgi:TolB-like protein/Tfp pilus assembly protein PilF